MVTISADAEGSAVSFQIGCGCIALITLIASAAISHILFLIVFLVMAVLGAGE